MHRMRDATRRASDRPFVGGAVIGIGSAPFDLSLAFALPNAAEFRALLFFSNGNRVFAGVFGGRWPVLHRLFAGDKAMTVEEVMAELRALGSESIKKVLRNHRVEEPFFGVKIGDMKNIQKRIKKDYELALGLYDTGNYDAMYFAGLIADDEKMTKKDLQRWVKKAKGGALASSTVPWVAAGSPHGDELAKEWIDAKNEHVTVAGWATLSSLVALQSDERLDVLELKRLLQRVRKTIHQQPNFVRYAMNDFVIAVGTYVQPLTDEAMRVAEKVGTVTVDMGNTSCQVPDARAHLKKAQKSGKVGKKRKTVKC